MLQRDALTTRRKRVSGSVERRSRGRGLKNEELDGFKIPIYIFNVKVSDCKRLDFPNDIYR